MQPLLMQLSNYNIAEFTVAEVEVVAGGIAEAVARIVAEVVVGTVVEVCQIAGLVAAAGLEGTGWKVH